MKEASIGSVSSTSPLYALSYNMCGNFYMLVPQALFTVQQSMCGGPTSQAHSVYSRPWNLIQQLMGLARIAKAKAWINNIFIGSQFFMAMLIVKLLLVLITLLMLLIKKAPNFRARFENVSLKKSIFWQTYLLTCDKSFFLTSCCFSGKAICDHLVVARLKRPWQKSPIDRTHISPYSRQITRGAGKSPQITPSVHQETASRPRLHLSRTFSTL